MVRTRDGREVKVGDWLLDTDDSMYEVTDVEAGAGNLNYMREVLIGEETDEFYLGDERILTRQEVAHMSMA